MNDRWIPWRKIHEDRTVHRSGAPGALGPGMLPVEPALSRGALSWGVPCHHGFGRAGYPLRVGERQPGTAPETLWGAERDRRPPRLPRLGGHHAAVGERRSAV